MTGGGGRPRSAGAGLRRRAAAALAICLLLAAPGCAPDAQPTGPPSTAPSATAATAPRPSAPATSAEPGPVEPAPLELTVMTYNTLTGRNDCAGCKAMKVAGLGDELKLSARMPVVAEKVKLADPDVIGFQENEGADPLPQARLARLLPGYAWANPEDAVPIAVRAARFTVVDSGLERLERGALTCTSRDRTDGRFASWALLRETATERELWVFNTHLHPYDQAACADLRAANVARLAELVTAKNPDGRLPQLILGDFNAFGDETRERFSAHLTTLRELGMADAAAIAAQDESDVPRAASAGWMTAPVKGRTQVKAVRVTGRHIDFIWVPKKAQVASWAVLSGPGVEHRRIRGVKVPVWSGVMGSDHSPVVARITLT